MDDLELSHPPFSDRELESYLVGELNDARRAAIEEAAAADPELQAHLEERRAEQRAFAQLRPTPAFLEQRSPLARRWLWQLAPIAAVGVLLVAVLTREPDVTVRPRGATDPRVEVIVKRGDRLFALATPPPLLRRGDALRVDVIDIDESIIILGFIDRQGGRVLLSAPVAAGDWSQPSSIVLDDAPGSETLVVVIAETPSEAKRAQREIEAGRAPRGAVTRTWEKEPLP